MAGNIAMVPATDMHVWSAKVYFHRPCLWIDWIIIRVPSAQRHTGCVQTAQNESCLMT
jgi:hypothetical protein